LLKQLRSRESLYRILADRLREEILSARWSHGEQIPTEGELVTEYGVSRTTVRQALSLLEHEGFIVTRHGSGRFISRPASIVSAGIEQLQSLTVTITNHGRRPGMRFLAKEWREAANGDAKALEIAPGDRVLDVRRAITADGKIVAFSHDVIPAWLLPEDFDLRQLKGSIFSFLEERCKVYVKTARAEVHAMKGADTDWDLDRKEVLFVVLDQIHYGDAAQPALYSKTYFIEGRFNFTVVRTR
jgi:GntR family transcriptional regulator